MAGGVMEESLEKSGRPWTTGMRVRIVNLKGRCELNGKEGELREWVDAEERWKVWLQDGYGKKLRAENLQPLDEGYRDSWSCPGKALAFDSFPLESSAAHVLSYKHSALEE